jgi:DNA-binding CsgD family transcriptional regulator
MNARGQREAIVRLYDAGTGDSSWGHALEHIATVIGADSAVLFSQLPGARRSSFLGGCGVSPEAMRAYEQYYGARNVLMQYGAHLHYPGTVRTSETICSADALLGSEYFNDFMRPNAMRFSLGITADRGDAHAVHLSAFRAHDRRAFGPLEQRAFEDLYPHIQQAVRLSARLESARTLTESLQTVGDALGKAVALLDAAGSVLLANTLFERLCLEKDGLHTTGGIVAVDGPSGSAFGLMLADAVSGGAGGTLQLARPSGRLPYSMLISPIMRRLSVVGAVMPRASLIVSEAQSESRLDVLGLQRRFDLTRAEARFVSRLARGVTVRMTCEELQVSLNTGRTHLKRAMAKMNVSRQADLVRVLLTSSVSGTA